VAGEHGCTTHAPPLHDDEQRFAGLCVSFDERPNPEGEGVSARIRVRVSDVSARAHGILVSSLLWWWIRYVKVVIAHFQSDQSKVSTGDRSLSVLVRCGAAELLLLDHVPSEEEPCGTVREGGGEREGRGGERAADEYCLRAANASDVGDDDQVQRGSDPTHRGSDCMPAGLTEPCQSVLTWKSLFFSLTQLMPGRLCVCVFFFSHTCGLL
jgi:hypothetical protein